jgi:hypothetical protein
MVVCVLPRTAMRHSQLYQQSRHGTSSLLKTTQVPSYVCSMPGFQQHTSIPSFALLRQDCVPDSCATVTIVHTRYSLHYSNILLFCAAYTCRDNTLQTELAEFVSTQQVTVYASPKSCNASRPPVCFCIPPLDTASQANQHGHLVFYSRGISI